MQSEQAVSALSALAQEHRLAVFRQLVQAGEQGLAAGDIATRLNIPNSSLSFHLSHLSRSGLIAQERRGRSLMYRANYAAMNDLVAFLMENCCSGASCAAAASPVSKSQDERNAA